MDQGEMAVGSMLKISLSIEAGSSTETMDLTPAPVELDFIFGIGSKGITPFEYELADKRRGDVSLLHVQRRSAPVLFEHLAFPILKNIDMRDEFYLKTSIRNVSRPENREIIKAMATQSSCGDDCDCGCGCNH